jgi:hypothetical protein
MDGILDRLFPANPVMGLLGDENMLQQARQQGLLGLAAGLLQAGGPSRTRTNIGQAIGSGLLSGQKMYQEAVNQQIQQAGTMQKLQEAQRQRQQQQLVSQLLPQVMTTERQQALTTGAQAPDPLAALIGAAERGTLDRPTVNQAALSALSGALGGDPDKLKTVFEAIQTRVALGQPKEEKSLFAAVDPSKYTPESISEFSRTKDYSVLRPTETEQFTGEYANIARVKFGTPNIGQLSPQQRAEIGQAALQSAAANATQINMPKEDAIFNKVIVPRIAGFSEDAKSSMRQAQVAETVNNLLKGAGGGGLVKLTTDVQRFLGIKSDTASRDDLAQALATTAAVGIRATGSGATSDLEFRAFINAIPSLSRTEEGRQFMADYARRIARRNAKLSDYVNKLAMEGRFSEVAIQDYDESLGALLTEDERGRWLPQAVARPAAGGVARQQGWVRD